MIYFVLIHLIYVYTDILYQIRFQVATSCSNWIVRRMILAI